MMPYRYCISFLGNAAKTSFAFMQTLSSTVVEQSKYIVVFNRSAVKCFFFCFVWLLLEIKSLKHLHCCNMCTYEVAPIAQYYYMQLL